jgi:hypothetical protein
LGSVNRRIVDQAQKITKAKRAGSGAQVVQHLPSKCEVLYSTPSTTKKKNTEKTQKVLTF